MNINFQKCPVNIEESFWEDLYHKKLKVYGLSNNEHEIENGKLILFNTVNEIKKMDKKGLMKNQNKKTWEAIKSGEAIKNPDLLFEYTILVYIDFKEVQFFYWLYSPKFNNDYKMNSIKNLPHQKEDKEEKLGNIYMIVNGKIKSLYEGWENRFEKTSYIVFKNKDNDHIFSNKLKNLLMLLSFYNFDKKEYKIVVLTENSEQNFCFGFNDSFTGYKNVTGWEDSKAKIVKLNSSLIENTTNLNLNLMKWRFWPEFDLGLIKKTRCLLLGSGTLGCSIARILLGWGFHNITFVDNGKISYSNPTRQSLYEFEDVKGGKCKAQVAAESLIKINPFVKANWKYLTIPMPSHPESVKQIGDLVKLIVTHDVVFLLTDTRESRWLPIMLSKFYKKKLFNLALGMSTYLIDTSASDACYFCNDVVPPVNSTLDKIVDQQCTISRMGLSSVVSGFAVEMLVSDLNGRDIPKCVRGNVDDFSFNKLETSKYPNCSCCSDMVLKKYDKEGVKFVEDVCNDLDSNLLKTISGLDTITVTSDNGVITF